MTEFLKEIFQEKFIVDKREPIATFGIPYVDGRFALLSPCFGPWQQLIVLSLVQSLIQILFACFIYKLIVQRRGTIESYLIGWGFVIPISLYIPYYLLDYLDIRNKAISLSSSCVMTSVFFRCLEAMYGTSPYVVESSIWNYCSYYGNVVPYIWNSKTGKRETTTVIQIFRSFGEQLHNLVALSLVLSVLIHFDFKPFNDTVGWTELYVSTNHFFHLGHICNSYCIAILLYFALKFSFEINSFGENIKGYATPPLFDSPLTKSTTPTEFWTKRWNIMTHTFLQRGIFEPSKLCSSSRTTAMFVTFLVSGLYHEYVWSCIFYNQKYLYDVEGKCTSEECYVFKFGRVTLFFAYTGIIMLLERPIRKLPTVKWLFKCLPTLVTAQLLVLIHVPFMKW